MRSDAKDEPKRRARAKAKRLRGRLETFIKLPHPEGGETTIESSRIHLSRSATFVDASAPTFARDMTEVLNGLLGYDDEKFGQLLIAGALE